MGPDFSKDLPDSPVGFKIHHLCQAKFPVKVSGSRPKPSQTEKKTKSKREPAWKKHNFSSLKLSKKHGCHQSKNLRTQVEMIYVFFVLRLGVKVWDWFHKRHTDYWFIYQKSNPQLLLILPLPTVMILKFIWLATYLQLFRYTCKIQNYDASLAPVILVPSTIGLNTTVSKNGPKCLKAQPTFW